MRDRRQLELDLRAGLACGELKVHFQPILDLERDEIVCCQALLCWNHPKRGLVSPSEFIPIAGESGLIIEIGDWALHQACVEAAGWPSR
jgi:EAL domain-containing protein (putative c-di-GMP-specific phosphodiesterase class I)